MYYIALDLEWNQAYAEKALAVQRRLCSRLRGEVIQIGAVKLDRHLNLCGSYQIIVKPKYFKRLHRHVSELTGITQDQMDMGTPLPEAAELKNGRIRSGRRLLYVFSAFSILRG